MDTQSTWAADNQNVSRGSITRRRRATYRMLYGRALKLRRRAWLRVPWLLLWSSRTIGQEHLTELCWAWLAMQRQLILNSSSSPATFQLVYRKLSDKRTVNDGLKDRLSRQYHGTTSTTQIPRRFRAFLKPRTWLCVIVGMSL